jgi:hypothetical protein
MDEIYVGRAGRGGRDARPLDPFVRHGWFLEVCVVLFCSSLPIPIPLGRDSD